MRAQTIIQMNVQRLACTACGAEAHASCNCGKPYVPKSQRIRDALADNPNKSTNEIAREVGADRALVRRVRDKMGGDMSPPEREGKDGKVYRLPVRDDDPEPSEADHEEGLRVIAVRGFLNRAAEAREIATLGKLTASDITEAMIVAADDAAAAWEKAAQQLRSMING